MNFIKFNKIVGLIAVIAVFAFAQNASAQNSASPQNQEVDFINETDIQLVIDDVFFNANSRNLNIKVTAGNATDKFFDRIKYSLELYKGEKLQTEGYLFDGLEIITVETGDLAEMPPNSQYETEINFNVPQTFEAGKYFIRLTASVPQTLYYGLAWTDIPVHIQGDGGFIPLIDGKVVTSTPRPNDQTVFELAEGPALQPEEEFTVEISFDNNPKLSEIVQGLSEEESLRYSYVIQNVNNLEQILRDGVETIELTEDGLRINFGSGQELPAGPNYVSFTLIDLDGKPIAQERTAVWLIEGFYSRITNIESDTNYYKKGEPLDVQVKIISYDSAGAPNLDDFVLSSRLTTEDGDIIEFSQNIKTSEVAEGPVNLNYTFDRKSLINNVDVSLYDRDGKLVDQFNYDIDTSWMVVDGEQLPEKNIMVYVWGGLSLIVLIAILVILYRRKKQTPMTIGTMILVLGFAVAGLIVADSQPVYATCVVDNNGEDRCQMTVSVNLSGSNTNLGTCPQTNTAGVSANIYCETCTNSTRTNFYLETSEGGNHFLGSHQKPHSAPWGDYVAGPYYKILEVTESVQSLTYNGSVDVTSGPHCYFPNVTYGDSKNFKSSSKTISCSPAEDPDEPNNGNDNPGNGNNNPNNGNNNPGGGDDEFSVFCGLNSASSIPADGETEAEWFAFASNASNSGSVVYKWTSAIGIDESTGSSNAFTYATELSGTIDDLVVEARSGNDIATISCPDVAFVPDIGLEFNATSPFASLETNTCSMNWTVGTDANSCSIVSEDGTVIFSTDFTDGREGTEEVVPGTRYKMSCEAIDDQGELITVESEFIGCNRVGDLNET